MNIPNPLSPDRMTASERLAEVAEILARGVIRLRARQSRQISADQRESFVDFPAPQRGHVAPKANVGDAE
jgi:hypothetical protein